MSPIFGVFFFVVLGVQDAMAGEGFFPVNVTNPDVQAAWTFVLGLFRAGELSPSPVPNLIEAQAEKFYPEGVLTYDYKLTYESGDKNYTATLCDWPEKGKSMYSVENFECNTPDLDADEHEDDDDRANKLALFVELFDSYYIDDENQYISNNNSNEVSLDDPAVVAAFQSVQLDLYVKVNQLMGSEMFFKPMRMSAPTSARTHKHESTTNWLISFTAARFYQFDLVNGHEKRSLVAAIENNPTARVPYKLIGVVDAVENNYD